VAPAGVTVGETSEEEVLRPVLAIFEEHRRWVTRQNNGTELMLGPGDDCAVYDLSAGRTVVTIDSQTQDQDYLLEWPNGYRTTGFDMGWKSAAQNVADVAAMGAIPTGLVISLVLPPDTSVDMVQDMARGYCAALQSLGATSCTVGGGDVGSGTEIGLTVAAFGLIPAKTSTAVSGDCGTPVVRRSGAQPGDVVVLAGTVGRAAAGLDLLRASQGPVPNLDTAAPESWAHPRSDLSALMASQLRPQPPIVQGPILAEYGATAMIDVSDGLLRDAERLATASNVRIELDSDLLEPLVEPLRPAASELGLDPLEWVLSGGEDHGLLACIPSSKPLPEGVRAIGSCGQLTGREACVLVDGKARIHRGWDHFAAKDRF